MLTEEELKVLYNWVDMIPLTRPKRKIERDFADGVLTAEIIYHYLPNLIEIHNYNAVNSVQQKEYNWKTLNAKVLRHLGMRLEPSEIHDIANSKQQAIEIFLLRLKGALESGAGSTYQRPATASDLKNSRNYNIQMGDATPPKAGTSQGQRKSPAPGKRFKVLENGEEAKEEVIQELKETIEILQAKISKMEVLVRLKDEKIDKLQNKLAAHGQPVD